VSPHSPPHCRDIKLEDTPLCNGPFHPRPRAALLDSPPWPPLPRRCRDIKLENTLLNSSPRPLLKLCDFGYSKHEKYQSAPGSRVGTPAYLAPEVILTTKGKVYDGKVSATG